MCSIFFVIVPSAFSTPAAPVLPESALPGVIIGAFIDDGKSGRCFCTQDFAGMTLEEAVERAKKTVPLCRGTIG